MWIIPITYKTDLTHLNKMRNPDVYWLKGSKGMSRVEVLCMQDNM